MNLWHFPLERYAQRYTQFLRDWEHEAFSKKFHVTTIEPDDKQSVIAIQQGEALDTVQRPIYCMGQMQKALMRADEPDWMFFSDFYTTGLDALWYSRKFKNTKKAAI